MPGTSSSAQTFLSTVGIELIAVALRHRSFRPQSGWFKNVLRVSMFSGCTLYSFLNRQGGASSQQMVCSGSLQQTWELLGTDEMHIYPWDPFESKASRLYTTKKMHPFKMEMSYPPRSTKLTISHQPLQANMPSYPQNMILLSFWKAPYTIICRTYYRDLQSVYVYIYIYASSLSL